MIIDYSKIAKNIFENNKDLTPKEQRFLTSKEMTKQMKYKNRVIEFVDKKGNIVKCIVDQTGVILSPLNISDLKLLNKNVKK